MTLTHRFDAAYDYEKARGTIAKQFAELRKEIRRKLKIERLPFVCSVEQTKNGAVHLHVLMRSPFIPQRWLSKVWQRIAGAPIVHICQIKNTKQAARYVAKYLGKAPARIGKRPGLWHSHDWAPDATMRSKSAKETRPKFRLDEQTYLERIQSLIANGMEPKQLSDRVTVWFQPWATDAERQAFQKMHAPPWQRREATQQQQTAPWRSCT